MNKMTMGLAAGIAASVLAMGGAMAQSTTAPATGTLAAPTTPAAPMTGTMRPSTMPPGATTPMTTPGTSPAGSAATTAPSMSGTAAASGNSNQAVATTSANAMTPAKGHNSFTMAQARKRLESSGFSNVSGLAKDRDGVWRGHGQKGGSATGVWLDYKGNVGQN